MCGIAGWIDRRGDASEFMPIAEAMAETLACRGPDASGIYMSRTAAIVHRRLVVVDPEGGAQPMERRVGERLYVITYNGELYNTAELRDDLTARGWRFFTRSDTEVLLVAYMQWGPGCLERLNGIFAFAIWNEADQTLFLARDRLGVKPLFYADFGDCFVFGSEPKALLAHPRVAPVVDAEGLAEVFALGPARTPGHAVYRDMREVKPGCCLTVSPYGLTHRRYWRLESRPHLHDLDTTIAKVRDLLSDAVRRQLAADVPVCTLLSGGVDSSAITAFAARAFAEEGKGPLHTYSIDYQGNAEHFRPSAFQPDSDDRYIQLVSERLGTVHHQVLIDAHELAGALPAAVRARDLPGMADIDASLLLFCREIKKGATVALSGECADEIFGGYPWFHREDLLHADTFPWSRSTHLRASWLAPWIRERIRPEDYVQQRYRESLAEVPHLPGESPRERRLREVAYLSLTWFMVTLLNRKDRMSMAAGLEARVPFADHRLVEYVWNVPWEMKNCGGREKGLLRRALEGVLPDEVLWRRKNPYPKSHQPEYAEAVRRWVLRILDDPQSPLLPLIDVETVRRLVAGDPAQGGAAFDQPWFGQLMAGPQFMAYLIEIDTWLREYRVEVRV
ncbi:MAG: asparagine synthase (glutamine-hydrolyzing) [Bacillota bacterium]